jgi:hypothetical protein
MLKILTNSASAPSARMLRNSLRELTGKKALVTSNPDRIKRTPFIRYGNSSPVSIWDDTDYNSPNFIKISSNKLKFSKIMKENEIYSPVYKRGLKDLTFPLLIRETLTSFGCKGIHVIKNQKEFDKIWRSTFWWTEFRELSFELRVHILGGKIVRIFKKQLEEPQEYPIRNNSICHFSLKNPAKYPKLDDFINRLTSVKEVNEGKFYSIDIGWDARNKKYFVIELNTGSGLNENTAQAYAQYLYENLLGG